MTEEYFLKHGKRKSRRERREEREKRLRDLRRKRWGNRASTFGRTLLGSSKKTAGRLFPEEEHEVPGNRRERRQLREKRHRERQRRGWRGGVGELIITIIVAFVLVFGLVRPFIVTAYKIPSGSMIPTLEVGDRILANKFIYRFAEPKRGDIVVFDSVDSGEDNRTLIDRALGFFGGGNEEEDHQTLIKRVVGVAGDKIRVRSGALYVNGVPQDEPYLNQERLSDQEYGPTRVPEGNIFVMGDNRGNSADSRVFGPLPLENLEGEAFVRFWPVITIGPLG